MSTLSQTRNPFSDSVWGDAWKTPSLTVPEINGSAYEACLERFRQVRDRRQTSSLLVLGEAGSGKTHLIARLRQTVTSVPLNAADPEHHPLFCWVRLDASAGRPWSFLRRSLFRDLLRSVTGHLSQLDRILRWRLPDLFGQGHEDQDFFEYWLNGFLNSKHKQLRSRLYDLSEECGIERDLREVLLRLHGEHAHLARDWLRGEKSLLAEEVGKLGLRTDPGDEGKREEESQRLVLSLCRLIGPETPLVVCVDQIEGIEVGCQDKGALGKFVDMLGLLHDQGDSSKLLISFILSGSHDRLRQIAGHSLWKRLAGHQTTLQPLTWESAVMLALQRMEAEPSLAVLRHDQGDRFWPLSESGLRRLYEQNKQTCTTRAWLEWCEKEYDRVSRPVLLDGFLVRQWEKCLGQARVKTSKQLDTALSRGLLLLGRLVEPAFSAGQPLTGKHALPHVGLTLKPGNGQGMMGVGWFGEAPSWQSLKAIRDRWDRKNLPILVLLFRKDPRTLGQGPAKYLGDLTRLGAKAVRLSDEQARALEGLRKLEAEAGTADEHMMYEGHEIGKQEVLSWAREELGRAVPEKLAALKELAYEVFSEPSAASDQGKAEPLHGVQLELVAEQP